jgi:hypothetical protein
MKVMNLKRLVMLVAILMLFSAPSRAGSLSAYGAYWDSKDADASWGAGLRVGFDLTKMLELEFHGTYFPSFNDDDFGSQSIDITAVPVDGGLKLNFLPDKTVNPFVGAGVSYYFLSVNPGSVDDETGVYIDGGLDIGKKDGTRFFAELMWRKVDTSIKFNAFNENVKFDGLGLNVGATWRWGS